jgi:hypothetical protein
MTDDMQRARHSARVYLTEARNRRNDPVNTNFCKTLVRWARNAHRRGMAPTVPAAQQKQAAQLELFA